ncbi:MAG: cysteine desulfurase NifS [Chloroflexi bacterium]|nr:cysteine desulfurase NifS [Chloroflexota bacterium]
MKTVYLDYAATTPAHPEVVKAMLPYFTENFGNPSSIYGCGQKAKGALEEARTRIARFLGAREEEVIFTSGGTEADNTAIIATAYANERKGNHVITCAIEHHAVLHACDFLKTRGFSVTKLPVDRYGLVSPDDVRKAITPKTILVTIMHANNEIGTIEPIDEIGKVCREAGVYFHTDAVQTVGHLPIDLKSLHVDMLSLSAHKLYGPKGVGALYVRKGTKLTSFLHGGAQERGRRASTENVAGVVGLAKAMDIAREDMMPEAERLTALRETLIKGLMAKIENVRLNGHPTLRLPNNVNVSIEYIEGESMCLNLDLEGICSSTGSACSSGSTEPSHVLLAIGIPPQSAHGSLRFTSGKWTTEDDIDRVLEVLPRVVAKLRAMSPLLKKKG